MKTLHAAGLYTRVKDDETLRQAAQRLVRRGIGQRKIMWREEYDELLNAGGTVNIGFIDTRTPRLNGSMNFRLEVMP